MLSFHAGIRRRNCAGSTRREMLQVGALGMAGLALSDLLSLRARAADSGSTVKDTSVVLLFLTGGLSQIESFDPKMSAPSNYRSVTGETATRIAGVTFGGTFTGLARCAHQIAAVRSFAHKISDHTKAAEHVMRGGNRAEAGMGTVVARLRDTAKARTTAPSHVHLNAAEIDPQFHKEKLRLLKADGPGELGGLYAPFQPGGDGEANRNLQLKVSQERLADRRSLHKAFDRFARQIDAHGEIVSLQRFEQQAFDVIVGKGRTAFDLSQESPRVIERYDTSRFKTGIKKHRASTLGKQLLLARRLCEAGCGFVTIHNPGWDMHGGDTQHTMPSGMKELGRPVDHAVSAFLEDVEQRGLSKKILLVITSEFGRTPKINKNAGRDHWPQLSSLALAGGGLKMGQVVGRSTAKAESPATSPITPENLLATVLHVLFDLTALRSLRGVPRSITTALEHAPIRELL